MAKIKVENLYKIFGNNPERGIKLIQEGFSKEELLKKHKLTIGINNASFSVEEGSIFVIMGLSGSGKSTIVRCLNRLIEPTAGQITIAGEDVIAMDKDKLLKFRRDKIGMVFQRFAIFPHRTVINNVAYGLEVQGMKQQERLEKAAKTIELVGLVGYEESYPNQLSGGMQQRVGLARALAIEPEILLMDEAFSALDPLIRKEMQDELLDLQSELNKTIIFITHDLDEALKLGDKIALMKDGAIVQIGTSEEILMQPATEYVAKFVEDVDRAKVLKAGDVMVKPAEVAFMTEGPRVIMRKMQKASISSIFVVDKKRNLQGIVTSDQIADLIKKGEKEILSVMEENVPRVFTETTLNDVLALVAEGKVPLAVTDDNNKLVGILIRGVILAGLAGGEGFGINGNDN